MSASDTQSADDMLHCFVVDCAGGNIVTTVMLDPVPFRALCKPETTLTVVVCNGNETDSLVDRLSANTGW